MQKLFYYIALAIVVFVALAWKSDIKPRIFTNPDSVKIKPEIKLGTLIYLGCFFVAFVLFVVLVTVVPGAKDCRIGIGCILACLAVFFGNYFTKRSLRRIFYDTSISLRMNPEDYAKTLCPHYVVQYIEAHLSDKEALAKYITQQKKLGRISDPCAWAFLVAYCDKRP